VASKQQYRDAGLLELVRAQEKQANDEATSSLVMPNHQPYLYSTFFDAADAEETFAAA
jgi:hypothetical protein